MSQFLHDALPVLPLVLPALFLVASVVPCVRSQLPSVLGFLPLPAVAAALFGIGTGPLTLTSLPWHPVFAIDRPGALLLGTAAVLWSAVGFCAPRFFRKNSVSPFFCVFWILTLLGSLGVFIAADLSAFLVCYVLVSLPAYALVIFNDSAGSRRAGAVYVGFALLGESVLLMAFVMLTIAAPEAGLGIRDLVAAMAAQGAWGNLTLGLLLAAFGMKIALVPLHFWMPLTYSAAPIPVAAVLSGAAVKAGIIGLIRFLPIGDAAPAFGQVLLVIGFIGAFFGVLVGVTQRNPKSVLAYSSISQMGFLAAVLGLGLIGYDGDIATVAAFYAAHHVLVKGALFLAVGLVAWQAPHRTGLVLLPAAVLGLGLAGLPFSGGALAKEAVKGVLGEGWPGSLAVLSAVGSAFLMWHFIARLTRSTEDRRTGRPGAAIIAAWLALAACSIAIPWLFFASSGLGTPGETLRLSSIWKNLWPVLVGGGLAWVWNTWLRGLPEIPPGDVAGLESPLRRAAMAAGKSVEKLDGWLRQWTVACLALLLLIAALFLGALGR